MANLPDFGTGTGLLGIIATGFAAITGGILVLRKYLSSDAVDRAGDHAQLDIINMLRQQVTDERARADAAATARDNALSEIRALKDQVAQLTLQVQSMQQQLSKVQITVDKTAESTP